MPKALALDPKTYTQTQKTRKSTPTNPKDFASQKLKTPKLLDLNRLLRINAGAVYRLALNRFSLYTWSRTVTLKLGSGYGV